MNRYAYEGCIYSYGFNGKENDSETATQDYGFRIYNPGLARFLSVDPLMKSYPWNSPYAFAENDVIRAIDLEGLEKFVITAEKATDVGGTTIDVAKADYIVWKLSFHIEYPDGTIEVLTPTNDVVMIENKSMQEGSKSPNALKTGETYKVDWVYYKNLGWFFQINSNGPTHSNKTYIHPLAGTSSAEDNANSYYRL